MLTKNLITDTKLAEITLGDLIDLMMGGFANEYRIVTLDAIASRVNLCYNSP